MIGVWYPTHLFEGPTTPVDIWQILLITVLFAMAIAHILTREGRARSRPPESSHLPDMRSIDQRWTGRG